ncbi:chorion peroxidase-like [Macrobrachium rosenbergii]
MMKAWLLGLLLVVGTSMVKSQNGTALDEDYDPIYHVSRVIRQIQFPGGGGGGAAPAGACNCAPLVTCAAELNQIQSACNLQGGVQGVCCPARTLASIIPPKGTGDNRILTAARVQVRMGNLDTGMVNQACEKGVNAVSGFRQLEQTLASNGIVLQRGSPASGHLRVFSVSERVKRHDQDALTILMASQNMVNDFSLTPQQGGHGLRNVEVSNTVLANRCPRNPTCTNSKYRTADGSCNNQRNTAWGMSGTPLQRILPPTYGDGLMSPRTQGVNGSPLPNVRTIGSNVLVDVDNPDQSFTSSVMQWAQFLDHDLTHAPFPTMENGMGIECCPNGQLAPENQRHPRCWPIDVSQDPFYRPRGQTCMNFIRSMLAVGPGSECTFGYAEQVNQLTHWLDGSMVYGSNQEQMNNLRTGQNGLMKTSGNNLLPINPNQGAECEAGERNARCYQAGDSRVNEQPGLTAIHVVWVREHNRIARDLQTLNPTWSDEQVFQEARRIVIAELQHITYNEWLPIIVGPNFMQSFGISTRSNGFSFDYNPNFNPSMNNEFSTAAFRFGHTLVQGTLRLFSATGQVSNIQLRDHFNSPHLIQNNPQALDMIIRSFARLAIQQFDPFITQDLTNHLFQTPRFNFGMDLMSLNIHRGRDHGIATYNDMRQICGLPRARNFNDITDQIPAQIAANLARIYSSVDDIDFFVGGITERPVSGGLLGWTFLCVVGDQFARVKKGDRFFYDLGGQPGSFTEPQLQEIRRSSWARVLCDNADNLGEVQPLAFMQSNSRFNQPVPCNSPQIPRPNLQLWRGERV